MGDAVRAWLLRALKVPAEPAAPPGDVRLLRTFRAAPSYFRYSVAMWMLKQASAAAGLLISYFFFRGVVMGDGAFGYFGLLERIALVGFVAQLPFSFALLRLDFELRWYMLSDRSLRIRHGIVAVREQTMAFANIQNIAIRQNPLQRLFGIATVVVQAAGGGSATSQKGGAKGGGSSHEATFEGVDNAEEIRSAIRERIRRHRDTGLGDPDDVAVVVPPARPGLAPALAAARRLADEAAAVRRALAGGGAAGPTRLD
jgi:membrane protein YdbS with pleckstrin-like domain